MRISINGANITDFQSFIDEAVKAMTGNPKSSDYFGTGLGSFHDCLYGGFIAEPPYDFFVENAEAMIEAFGHHGMVKHCDYVLGIIDAGRDVPDRDEKRRWYDDIRKDAINGAGPTLMERLFDIISGSPASLTLYGREGNLLAQVVGSYQINKH